MDNKSNRRVLYKFRVSMTGFNLQKKNHHHHRQKTEQQRRKYYKCNWRVFYFVFSNFNIQYTCL